MRLVLLCNYPPDAQQSMLRFGALLQERWAARGCDVTTLAPQPGATTRTLRKAARGGGAAKWLGYLDKYILFPPRLARRLREFARDGRSIVHVVDHSNALYVPRGRPAVPWVVTCHDLLAVRGARGEDTDCPASALGRRLQRSIVRGLRRAAAIATDSTSTLHDVERVVAPTQPSQVRRVILLGLNHAYRKIDTSMARARLRLLAGVPWDQPFLLHVGSNLPRKNKGGVFRVFVRAAGQWPGNLVFCGAELPADVRAHAVTAGVADRVFAAPSPDNAQLEAVYALAHALLYPSKGEGFGWPIIEAQACGCPVVCSDRTSLPEVGGEAALVHALTDEAGMATSVLRLTEAGFRAGVVARGHANVERFATDRMIDAYGEVYEEVLAASASR